MTSADYAATAPWAGIQARPIEFPPAPHTHGLSDLERGAAKPGDIATFNGKRWEPQPLDKRAFLAETLTSIAKLTESVEVVSTEQLAMVEKATEIEARFNEAASAESVATIEQRVKALAKKGEASASVVAKISARVGDSEASIKRVDRVIATRDTALAEASLEIKARVAKNNAAITEIRSAYATRTFSEAKKTEAISAAALDATAKVAIEATARAAADSAEAALRIALSAQVNHVTTGLPAAHAAITTEASTRATADTAIASTVTTLSAQVNHVSTGLPAAHAAIVTEATARATADTANASSITTLSAQVNHVTTGLPAAHAAVTTEASVRASADGAIHARWGVNLDINGRITGKVQLDGTNASTTLTVLADQIRFFNGTSDIAPFAISGGVVRMQNVVVAHELDIGTGDNRTQITGSTLSLGGGIAGGSGGLGSYTLRFGSASGRAFKITATVGSLATTTWHNAAGETVASCADTGEATFVTVNATGAGYSVAGNRVVGARGATVTAVSGTAATDAAIDIPTSYLDGADTMSKAAMVAYMEEVDSRLNETGTLANDLKAAVNALISRLKTTGGHGLISD